ncbi:hypothetical protein KIN20_021624 [Parelaphostrongylus tenuis]|uniref:Uncharacterized protein n=1 Tax=Parelaphostrongylus tenuis TaxID=148309 RepID=A0AAD5QWB6_PARTN|nr:hypothetical protein KIN20_021624 [Parelaphostrongylus tenuis]
MTIPQSPRTCQEILSTRRKFLEIYVVKRYKSLPKHWGTAIQTRTVREKDFVLQTTSTREQNSLKFHESTGNRSASLLSNKASDPVETEAAEARLAKSSLFNT